MSSPSPRPSSSDSAGANAMPSQSREANNNEQPPSLYNIVMTPVNFVTFLFSLLLVDLHYSLRRSHTHSEAPSRLPSWLHNLVYRPQPYDTGRVKAEEGGQWYYHSKQKKLLKMEAEEAFRLRNIMLALLGVAAIVAATGAWYMVTTVFRRWIPA